MYILTSVYFLLLKWHFASGVTALCKIHGSVRQSKYHLLEGRQLITIIKVMYRSFSDFWRSNWGLSTTYDFWYLINLFSNPNLIIQSYSIINYINHIFLYFTKKDRSKAPGHIHLS
jgi:hypothetical protein